MIYNIFGVFFSRENDGIMKNGIILLIFGLLVAAMGLYFSIKIIKKLINCTADISAECTDIKKHRHEHDSGHHHHTTYSYSPVLSYRVNGNDYSGEADISSSSGMKFSVGQRFDIKYNPGAPDQFIVKGKSNGLPGYIFLTVVGIFLTVLYFVSLNA